MDGVVLLLRPGDDVSCVIKQRSRSFLRTRLDAPTLATIYRNYFVPVAGGIGQTAKRQIDGLAEVGEALSGALGRSVETLWQMRNGYALCHQTGLESISAHLAKQGSDDLDALRARLRIGVQTDVEGHEKVLAYRQHPP